MREIAAIVVLVAAGRLINLQATEPEFISGLAMLVSLGALVFLAASLAERFNPNIKKWHRITPGKKTELDEAEWNKIGEGDPGRLQGNAPPMLRNAPPVLRNAPAARRPPLVQSPPPSESPPPPEKKPAAMFYDSGFDSSAGKKAPQGPDQFDEIFGSGEKDPPP